MVSEVCCVCYAMGHECLAYKIIVHKKSGKKSGICLDCLEFRDCAYLESLRLPKTLVMKKYRGRIRGSHWKSKELDRVIAIEMIRQGASINEVHAKVRLARPTILRIRKEQITYLPQDCPCGKKNGHTGRCSYRWAKRKAERILQVI